MTTGGLQYNPPAFTFKTTTSLCNLLTNHTHVSSLNKKAEFTKNSVFNFTKLIHYFTRLCRLR